MFSSVRAKPTQMSPSGPHTANAVRPAAREQDQRGQSPSGKSAEEERVENVAYVFEEQRPARAVERIHLADSPDFGTGGRGDEQGVHQRGYEQHGHGDFRDIPDRAALKVEHDGSDQGSDHDHGLQADQPALEEVADGHLFPPVVVGVADDEAGENEEEIDGQVSVIDFLVQMTGGVGFEQMEADDRQGCHSAQSVQYVVMRLGVGESGGGNFRLRHGFREVRVRSFVLGVMRACGRLDDAPGCSA